MPSPRATLLASAETCLKRIKISDGYNTDGGDSLTLEPGAEPASKEVVIALLVARQARPTDPAKVRSHRLTTLGVVAKLAADIDDKASRMDAIVSDIERAMADQQFRYPVGYDFPQYQAMEPIDPQPGSGWSGAVIYYATHIPIL